jgi:hypothetical protein
MSNRQAANQVLTILIAVSLVLGSMIIQQSANGQEFRIESTVYTADSNLPVSQNTTLFSQGLVYDFQLSDDAQPKPLEIVIFDTRSRTIVLLDPIRKIRLEMPDLQLLKIVNGVRRETVQDKRSSFLVDDAFQEDIDWSTNWVTLTSPQIEYRFRGSQPKDVSVIAQYNDFLDNFTMLIASDPTKIPPFARMKLNQSITRLGWIPLEVQISVKQNSLFRQAFNATSKHVIIHQLSDEARTKIATAKQQWMQFKPVELREYRGLKKKAILSRPIIATATYKEAINPKSKNPESKEKK